MDIFSNYTMHFLYEKLKLNFCRHKIYLSPVELGIIAHAKPFQTLTFDEESCRLMIPRLSFFKASDS